MLYSLANLFDWTSSWFLWGVFCHTAIYSQRLFTHKQSPLSIARYSFIQLSELEHNRVNELAKVQHSKTEFKTESSRLCLLLGTLRPNTNRASQVSLFIYVSVLWHIEEVVRDTALATWKLRIYIIWTSTITMHSRIQQGDLRHHGIN